MRSFNGMAAMEVEAGKFRSHVCFTPFEGVLGLVGDSLRQFDVIQISARFQHVLKHELR
ncbi:MAG: hypothetical protein A4E72_01432 [Syntrophus sp. PtaU1.Bin208]|nr:MAG: hypothetical protein A4E72_01432 [Syntrophus sp. PtaU1.Bin208]